MTLKPSTSGSRSLRALLESEAVQDALHLIQRRPHFEHVTVEEHVNPARASRAGHTLAKQMTANRARQATFRPIAGLLSVPLEIYQPTNETTFDTVPNRFVKYVLTRWQSIALDVRRALAASSSSQERGRREAQAEIDELEVALVSPALRDAGRLERFPHSNQVLQGRAGYRELLEAFLLAEAAASINWQERDRLFRAGQRNVAELYEYWVFLELVRLVGCLPGFSVTRRDLVRHTSDGLSLELRRRGRAVVTAVGIRRGTRVVVRVWFNKDFQPGSREASSSWTVLMRPDCSIEIAPENRAINADTWVHFDAKYRIHELTVGLEDLVDDDDRERVARDAQRPISDDLAKMHSYRDAIRRTAGAYVLYPGRDGATAVQHREYHEILPGLGAFVLRPTEDGESSRTATRALTGFLDDIIDHVAAQGTADERSRFWTRRSYQPPYRDRIDHDELLTKPPADTSVLLGYTKDVNHRAWVVVTGLYNVRADPGRAGALGVDAPELTPDFVLLYDQEGADAVLLRATGTVSVQTAQELRSAGYRDPGGSRYFCLGVELVRHLSTSAAARARELAREGREPRQWAAPALVTWSDVAAVVERTR